MRVPVIQTGTAHGLPSRWISGAAVSRRRLLLPRSRRQRPGEFWVLRDFCARMRFRAWLLRVKQAIQFLLEPSDERFITARSARLGRQSESFQRCAADSPRQPLAPVFAQAAERTFRAEQRVGLAARMSPRARPLPLLGFLDQTCPHGIEFHITRRRPQMFLVQSRREKAPLPQMLG